MDTARSDITKLGEIVKGASVPAKLQEEGPLLGFDDHFVPNIERDPRGYKGHDELVNTANKVIKEYYAFK